MPNETRSPPSIAFHGFVEVLCRLSSSCLVSCLVSDRWGYRAKKRLGLDVNAWDPGMKLRVSSQHRALLLHKLQLWDYVSFRFVLIPARRVY